MIENKYADYDENEPVLSQDRYRLAPITNKLLRRGIQILLPRWQADIIQENLREDDIAYGVGGYALLYYRIWKYTKSHQYLEVTRDVIDSLRGKGNFKISFLEGTPGMFSLGTVVNFKLDNQNSYKRYLSLLLSMVGKVCDTTYDDTNTDELVSGRCGYLYCLLFVRHETQKFDLIPDQAIRSVVDAIFKSGVRTFQKLKGVWRGHKLPPLFYLWNDSPYICAAHGMFGILYLLMLAKIHLTEHEISQLIRPTLDFIIQNAKYPSGNYQSTLNNQSDTLVQWCHGAPGIVSALLTAYKTFGDEYYLEEALKCGDITWKRGLLTKGYGLCHGVAGNGYAFLSLYRATKDARHLHRAVKFAEFCCAYGEHGCEVPNRPLSLFGGLAGTLYFLLDVVQFNDSAFPAYELPKLPEDFVYEPFYS